LHRTKASKKNQRNGKEVSPPKKKQPKERDGVNFKGLNNAQLKKIGDIGSNVIA